MYAISSAFRTQIENDNRFYAVRLVFTFADSTTLTVTNSSLWAGGVRFEDAVSGDNEFQVGSAIVNKLSVTLNNINDEFSSYEFEDATVVAYIGINLPSGASEYYRRGTYIVDTATGQNTSLIKLECLDFMKKFDKEYALVVTNYPATVQTIVRNICTACGVTLQTTTFYNGTYVVQKRPESDGLTCRQVLAYAAQIACSFCRMDPIGRLQFKWYGSADSPNHSFTSIYNITTSRFMVDVTGVKVTEEFPETETAKKGEYQYGVDGYVLDISGNDLIQDGTAQIVAEAVGSRVVGMQFKVVDATVSSDPSVEAGDTATITDEKGNTTFFYVTRVVFETDNSMQVGCSAKSPVTKASSQYSEMTRALIKARQTAAAQISEYDLAVQNLTTLMAESFGLFKTEEVQQDGSTIYILHNKPDLADSNIQWKMTAGALAVSEDGGQTWRAGIDAQGNAVVNVLSAVGVNADWISAGRLAVSDAGGTPLFIADYDTKSVYISGDRVFIGDESATDAISQLSGVLTVSLSNESQGIPVDADGDYTTFPTTFTNIRVLYGGQDVTMSCTLTDNPFGIIGTLTNNGSYYTYTATGMDAETGYVSFTAKYNTGTETVQNTKRFNLYKVRAGKDGPAGIGEDARIYFIEPTADILKQGQDNAYIPPSITFYAYYRTGSSVDRVAYAGLFKVEETTDGTTWTTVEQPTTVKTSTVYTPSSTNIAAVRATLYAEEDIKTTIYGLAGGDTTSFIADADGAMFQIDREDVPVSGGKQLDIQTAAVVKDVSALDQDQIFNLLTNNRQDDALIFQNGRIYLNATQMATGVLWSRNSSGPQTYWNLETGVLRITKNNTTIFSADTSGNGVNIVANNFSLTSGETIDSIADSKADAALTEAKNYADSAADSAVDGMSQKDVFDKLTKNGTVQGLRLANGELYINATYINSGTLNADRIGTGSIKSSNYAYSSGNFSTAGTLIQMSNGLIRSKQFAIDGNGNAIFSGTLSAATGTFSGSLSAASGSFSGSITGGSININNKFKVENTGAVTASDMTITGGSIKIGSAFNVTSAGAVTASNLSITGGSISIGSNFSVNTNGALTCSGATINGTIQSTSGNLRTRLANGALSVGSMSGSTYTEHGKIQFDAQYSRIAITGGSSVFMYAPNNVTISAGQYGNYYLSVDKNNGCTFSDGYSSDGRVYIPTAIDSSGVVTKWVLLYIRGGILKTV